MSRDIIEDLIELDPVDDSVGSLVELDGRQAPRKHSESFISQSGESLKNLLGGLLESKPAEALMEIGSLGQRGLLGIGSLLTGRDLSRYATPPRDPLTEDERKSGSAGLGRFVGNVAPSILAPIAAETALPEVISGATREAAALGLGGAASGAAQHSDEPISGALEEGLLNLGTFGLLKGAGKGAKSVKELIKRLHSSSPEETKSFLIGALASPDSAQSHVIRGAYGEPVAEKSTLQRIMGEEYQKHALDSGKHINDNGLIRPLSEGIHEEEANPVYNGLEKSLAQLEDSSSGRLKLNKDLYKKAIDEAKEDISETTRQSIPPSFFDEVNIPDSPIKALRRYRQLNRRVLNKSSFDPDVGRAATSLKKGIVDQFEQKAKDSPELRSWLSQFKKANRGFAKASKFEKRYKGIKNTIGGMAPEDVINKLINSADKDQNILERATKDFGDIKSPFKRALLSKYVRGMTSLYHPTRALDSYEALSPEVRKILFHSNDRKALDKLLEAKNAISALSSPSDVGSEHAAAHAIGLLSELSGIPSMGSQSLPFVSRLLRESGKRKAFERGRRALAEDLEKELAKARVASESAPESSNRSRVPYYGALGLSSLLGNTEGDER